MKIGCLAATVMMAAWVLSACGDDTPDSPPEPFELDGGWIYLGPSDPPHTLTISDSSMVYTAVDGTWSSEWNISDYDNALHQFRVAFGSGAGTYVPLSGSTSGAYELGGTLLTIQLAPGPDSYPTVQNAGTCTDPVNGTPTLDCRLYIKEQ